ncbi:MAG: bifunctional diaminohydroxyphosphoribosylaminopyrimidine deaminase/5-amino-6-(5-phosphoribosylamino)uracil reductase RibD [Firmicutes bacterium]|nr:bifunctional diaminohydroxyphosphoribosylaminopyrimidine deaminase/5-amino-6-(5-phosphoribosylamino)uracil reductase RibD [Bacillota bacterium]
MDSDERYMWMALDLARQGRGKTSPNPLVGAILVKDGEVVGTGFHKKAGDRHAEIIALQDAAEKARAATLYINLEPCCHYGKTPPCTEAIIRAGVRKVVIAVIDPNPLVSGKGIRRLEKAGIKIKLGVLEDKAKRLNEVYFKYITTQKPFVIVKTAMTLDGKIATSSGESRWISGERSRKFVHRLRSVTDGIMVGINTALQDDPLLTARFDGVKSPGPVRIIVDSKGRLPLDSKIVKTASEIKTVLATTESVRPDKIKVLESSGVEILMLPQKKKQVSLQKLMSALGAMGITSLLVEGGGTLNYSLLNENIIDKIYFFIAPLLFGGENAPSPLGGTGVSELKRSWSVENMEVKQLDNDLLVIGYPVRREQVVHRDSGRVGGNIKSAT